VMVCLPAGTRRSSFSIVRTGTTTTRPDDPVSRWRESAVARITVPCTASGVQSRTRSPAEITGACWPWSTVDVARVATSRAGRRKQRWARVRNMMSLLRERTAAVPVGKIRLLRWRIDPYAYVGAAEGNVARLSRTR
jgi:hypothetical protein